MKRRHLLTCAGTLPLLLAGCASTQTPTRWYELKSEPPEAVPAPRPGDGSVWELSGRLPLPALGTLLRLPDEAARIEERGRFVADLKRIRAML